MFQSTPPMQGATPARTHILFYQRRFQSTPPMQGATRLRKEFLPYHAVSIHAPYAGSDQVEVDGALVAVKVSIHAPYAGSDMICRSIDKLTDVSIHAPYAGSDVLSLVEFAPADVFQSTPPMQGATFHERYGYFSDCFNPRPLCRERRFCFANMDIEITVSIHAPYAGSDYAGEYVRKGYERFNPRPLCRERRVYGWSYSFTAGFQSTPPMQGATICKASTI